MTSVQKIALSFLITLVLFAGFLLTFNSYLFGFLEAKFYSQARILEKTEELNQISKSYDEYFKNKSQKEAYEVYYKTLYDIIKNYNNYSVVGHGDLIKRYGNYSNILKDSLFIDIIESILKEAIYKGKGIEINTSCFRYKLPDLTPSRKIISLYKDLGGEIITTGSDAHSPAFISCKFDYICSYLKDLGFKYISTFNNLKPNFIKL